MSGQSKIASFVEACVGTGVGLIFSFLLQKILNHVYEIEMSNEKVWWVIFWFTVFSILRSYVVRRIGNLPYWEKRMKKKAALVPKGSTRMCPDCGCTHLVLLSSLNAKVCTDCGTHIPWYLEDGQKPLL